MPEYDTATLDLGSIGRKRRQRIPGSSLRSPEAEAMQPEVDAAIGRMNEFAARTNATQRAYGLRDVDPALRAARTQADMQLGSVQDRQRRVNETYWQPKMQQEAQASELARTRAQFAEPAEIQGKTARDVAERQAKSAEDIAAGQRGVDYTRAQLDLLARQTDSQTGLQGKLADVQGRTADIERQGIMAELDRQGQMERGKLTSDTELKKAIIGSEAGTVRQTQTNATKLAIELGQAQAQAATANDALARAQESGDAEKIRLAADKAAVANRTARNIQEQLDSLGGQTQPSTTLRQPQQAAVAGQSGGYAEGTIIRNAQGVRMIRRNGKWENL